MNIEEGRIKHLEMIQVIISRMANNSFLLKAWTITLICTITAFSNKDYSNKIIGFISFMPTALFFFLDSYYLWLERLYRCLFNEVRLNLNSQVNFDMNTIKYKPKASYLKSLGSISILGFYIPLLIFIALILRSIK
jgi:hypothetical protein